MRSLSLEMNRELMAKPCERIIWSGGGAEAGRDEDMMKARLGKPDRDQQKYVLYIIM
jgi:hypothetical protein